MTEALFPARKRCMRCRCALGRSENPVVLLGKYCSANCAGIPAPVEVPRDAPRECRTERDGRWVFKRRYRSTAEIPERIREQPATSWYWCQHCAHLHVGRTQLRDDERFRMFEDLEDDLPDLLVKLRGQATHTQVAAVAGVRPIRLKELEKGMPHPEGLRTLGKVLKVYRVRLGVALPSAGETR